MEEEEKIFFGGHLVAFLDVLGQSNKLSDLKKFKWWESEKEAVLRIRDTYGIVLRFRETFKGFLSKFCSPSPLDIVFQNMADPEQLKIWDQFGPSRILTKGISDSLIMTLPLLLSNGLAPLKSIYGVLGACASSFLVCLNYKFSFRGAVEIGPCIFDVKSGEVYGSALNDAVKYEKFADWPRIIVGPALFKYIEDCTKLPGESITDRINASMARKCLDFITRDDSGNYFVDILGKGFEDLNRLQDTEKIINGALKFINAQIKEYGLGNKTGLKYSKLQTYFESRLGL